MKREVSSTEKRFKIAIMFSRHRQFSREERNGFVKAYIKQVIIFMYLRDFFALNSSVTTVFTLSAFYPYSAVLILNFAPTLFYSQSAVCILPLVHSLQSVFYTDRCKIALCTDTPSTPKGFLNKKKHSEIDKKFSSEQSFRNSSASSLMLFAASFWWDCNLVKFKWLNINIYVLNKYINIYIFI